MNILLVEDEKKLADIISRGLKAEGYVVEAVHTARDGNRLAASSSFDLLILDLHLPDLSGTHILRTLRQQANKVPVLILTARDELETKAENFAAGADDYLTKPFAFAELVMRVKALLRRGPLTVSDVLTVADLEVDRLAHQVRRDGRRIELSPKEFGLLEYLALNPRRVLSRSMILDHVWDQSFEGITNIVDVYVRQVRRKIDEGFERKLIRTVRGAGYMLDASTEAG